MRTLALALSIPNAARGLVCSLRAQTRSASVWERDQQGTARGGSASARYGNLDEIAWYSANSEEKTHAVGQKKANGFGLYDMLGNVWEWTAEWYKDSYYKEPPEQHPQGPSAGEYRVLRGGSWSVQSWFARASRRGSYRPSARNDSDGFRCSGEKLVP